MRLNLNRANLSLDPLNAAINDAVERASLTKHAGDQPRGYLGASLIGDECSRKIQFEWLTGSTFPARVHSIFSRGHYFEIESRQQLVEAGFIFEPSVERLNFTIVNADTCERLHFTFAFDALLAQEASDRAVSIIEATRAGELLPRIDFTCEDFRCRMCSYRERCLRHD